MAFRVVKINNRCKLETQLGYLVCRSDKETKILLNEIELLIIENQQVCITSALISELMNHKIRVIFCDNTHQPQGEVFPYNSCYDTYGKIKQQIAWEETTKSFLWNQIVRQKIHNQSYVLRFEEKFTEANTLEKYEHEVQNGDIQNREGLAAKLYFSSLFGDKFDRRKKNDKTNIYLNYGYSILLSMVNREIASSGYLNQLGVHHIGEQNPFNLGCDFMEPFRPFVDKIVIDGKLTDDNYKSEFIKLLSINISCNNQTTLLDNAIHNFVLDCLAFLNRYDNHDIIKIKFLDEQL